MNDREPMSGGLNTQGREPAQEKHLVVTTPETIERADDDRPRRTAAPHISIGSWHMPLPRSKWLRMTIGCLLVLFGCLGFLPILGFWMVPLGLVVLSHDSAYIRRKRRRMAIWWGRRRQAKAQRRAAA